MTGVKMAKASEADIDAAGELCKLLNVLDEGNRWSSGALGDTVDFFEIEDFDPEKKSHLESLYDKLMNLMHAQPSFHSRVIGGMCYVIMYDQNEIINPDSNFLDLHPRFSEAFDDLERETQAARYWNMRYHQVVQELDQVKLSAQRISQEWATIWSPIDDLVRPLTKLGESISAKAVELINQAMTEPDFTPLTDEEIERIKKRVMDTFKHPRVNHLCRAVQKEVIRRAMPIIPKQEPVATIHRQGNAPMDVRFTEHTEWGTTLPHGYKLYGEPVPAKEPRGQNRYGLDMSYMVGKLNILIRDIDNYKGDEAARTLLRLAKVADESVFKESEFSVPAQAAAIPEDAVNVRIDDLKRIHRDLDACQKVIWLAGGFDPAYCKDAQESLKLIDSALLAAPKPDSTGGE